MKTNLINLAKGLIDSSDYLTLSTTGGNKPWSTPLYFAHDSSYNFYFISRKDTRHSKNIYKNKFVSFCIFNSEDRSFTAQGLQAEGLAVEVKTSEILKALICIYKKKHPKISDFKKQKIDIKEVSGVVNNRIYKIVPKHIFMLDTKNPDMDTRIEISLN